MSNKKKLVLAIVLIMIILIIALAACVPSLVEIIKKLWSLLAAHDDAGFSEYVRSFGWKGVMILLVVQAFQVFFPIFPEVLLQIAAGATYGTILGTLILMLSYTICNYTIFLGLRHWHFQLPEKLFASGPLQKCRRLITDRSPETVVFILYLFPFLSNCFVPFIAVQTGISFRRYAGIMLISCLPMMLVSVYLGDRLLARDWLMAAVAFVVGAGASIILYFGQNKILAHLGTHPSHGKDT